MVETNQLIDEIRDVLKPLQLNKASGADKISNKMLKYTSESVCYPLQILFNQSLREYKFTSQWKLQQSRQVNSTYSF